MQYTGIKDKNGKEIFVGDFFKRPYDYDDIYIVEDLLNFGFYLYDCCIDGDCIEIIRNIYENPELLNNDVKPFGEYDRRKENPPYYEKIINKIFKDK